MTMVNDDKLKYFEKFMVCELLLFYELNIINIYGFENTKC